MLRLRSLTLDNFKNVRHGSIVLSNVSGLQDMGNGADVTGIYGQNGSGKTSFIQALDVLKTLWSGHSLPMLTREYIGEESDRFSLRLEFFLALGDDEAMTDYVMGVIDEEPPHESFICRYDVSVGKCSGRSPLVLSESLKCKNVASRESLHEVFSWFASDAGSDGEGAGEGGSALDYSSVIPSWLSDRGEPWAYELSGIAPATHWDAVYSFAKNRALRLEASRHKAFEEGKSLLFSDSLLSAMLDIIHYRSERNPVRSAFDAFERVLLPTVQIAITALGFAVRNMAVLNTSHQGLLALSYLPLASHEGDRGGYTDNFLLLDIEKVNNIPVESVDELERALESINGVLGAIVPGLRVTVARLGKIADKNGETLESVELMSERGDIKVPLRNESEGIKKILSIVSLLIDVHTNPSTLFAIDELDSGVFEYLLGEILEAIVSHGAGQLVFTAHNLRPLEVLDSKNIWFTTTDPADRYVPSKGVRGTNNLRRMYLRRIRLGGGKNDVYVPTSPLEIDGALYDAGVSIREMRLAQRDGGSGVN